MTTATNVVELQCSECHKTYDAAVEQHLCTCGRPLLVRYDLKRAGATLTAAEVAEFCGSRLARFKVPKYVTFVDALPRTASGKVVKRELRGRP